MAEFNQMDSVVTLGQQLEESSNGAVVLINKFDVPPDQVDRFLDDWRQDAQYMKHQSGYISDQLHRGIGGSGVFINVAVWDSIQAFRRALAGFRMTPARVVASPHLFHRVAVSDVFLGSRS